jgi:DRG Family Regulatory Proteins, Tma46
MDKSPLKTLTLEDFLETARHELTGTLTPVTAESFEKWKKERLDKKAAEEEARKAKEASGRALFEAGGWEESSEEEDSEEEDDYDDDAWNLEKLRRETEAAEEAKEAERIAKMGGGVTNGVYANGGGGEVYNTEDGVEGDGVGVSGPSNGA